MASSTEIPPPPTEFRLLEKELKNNGMTYVQIKRTPTVALYKIVGQGWEVIRIKIQEPVFMKIIGKWIPEREAYPSNEEFGVIAWCYSWEDRDRAEAKYEAECKRKSEL